MSTKETLRRRKDIPDEQVEELVARAARIQEDAQRSPEAASENEIAAVAQELDIEPQYVEAAIAQWRSEQESAPEAASRDRVKQRGKTVMKGVLMGGALLAIGVPLVAWGAWATFGSTALWAMGGMTAALVAGLVWLLS